MTYLNSKPLDDILDRLIALLVLSPADAERLRSFFHDEMMRPQSFAALASMSAALQVARSLERCRSARLNTRPGPGRRPSPTTLAAPRDAVEGRGRVAAARDQEQAIPDLPSRTDSGLARSGTVAAG